jgi:glutamate-ammonia-ligase adenylyltransferase
MEELSNLAEAVIQCVYGVCLHGLMAKHGTPRYQDASGTSRDANFTILAMGKLGGQELNYSSDIDLIYIYSGEQGQTEATAPSQASISNMEFFAKLAQAITRVLSASTEEGYFYRVDLRLRPEGSAGPVASSLSACKNYYGSWGETFERLALIKARPVGGSAELGEEFCRTFNSFIYRKFLDFAALDEIQEIKSRIEAKLSSRKSHDQHVKLGTGGIREVEFFVQALQLIYGGRQPELQQRSTLRALAELARLGYLQLAEHQTLAEAYLFLRDLEHKLQMVHHFQTHELPSESVELYRCARRMDFKANTEAATVDLFLTTLKQHRAGVRRSFHDLVSRKRIGGANEQMREAALILNRNLNEVEALEVLSQSGFNDPRTALHQVKLLRDAQSFAHSPSKMRNLLANLLPPLLATLRLSPDPDTGLSYFERFASSLGARDALYTLLNESPTALHRLLHVLSSSQFLADFLCRQPQLLDFLLRDEFLEGAKTIQDYLQDFRRELQTPGDWRMQTQALREIQQLELFRIQLRDILEANDRPSVGAQLADLAEACLFATCKIACSQLEEEGDPGLTEWVTEHLVILSLGKLGGKDLSYNSDLDLVCFYSVNGAEQPADVQQRASCVVERINEILSVSRGEGSIYTIDTRLRPEGKKGGVVTAIHRYEEYLRNRAAPWERLALVRHRFVFGSEENCCRLGTNDPGFCLWPATLRAGAGGDSAYSAAHGSGARSGTRGESLSYQGRPWWTDRHRVCRAASPDTPRFAAWRLTSAEHPRSALRARSARHSRDCRLLHALYRLRVSKIPGKPPAHRLLLRHRCFRPCPSGPWAHLTTAGLLKRRRSAGRPEFRSCVRRHHRQSPGGLPTHRFGTREVTTPASRRRRSLNLNVIRRGLDT